MKSAVVVTPTLTGHDAAGNQIFENFPELFEVMCNGSGCPVWEKTSADDNEGYCGLKKGNSFS